MIGITLLFALVDALLGTTGCHIYLGFAKLANPIRQGSDDITQFWQAQRKNWFVNK